MSFPSCNSSFFMRFFFFSILVGNWNNVPVPWFGGNKTLSFISRIFKILFSLDKFLSLIYPDVSCTALQGHCHLLPPPHPAWVPDSFQEGAWIWDLRAHIGQASFLTWSSRRAFSQIPMTVVWLTYHIPIFNPWLKGHIFLSIWSNFSQLSYRRLYESKSQHDKLFARVWDWVRRL